MKDVIFVLPKEQHCRFGFFSACRGGKVWFCIRLRCVRGGRGGVRDGGGCVRGGRRGDVHEGGWRKDLGVAG